MSRPSLARAWWYFAMTWAVGLSLAILAVMVHAIGWKTTAVLVLLSTITVLALIRVAMGRPS